MRRLVHKADQLRRYPRCCPAMCESLRDNLRDAKRPTMKGGERSCFRRLQTQSVPRDQRQFCRRCVGTDSVRAIANDADVARHITKARSNTVEGRATVERTRFVVGSDCDTEHRTKCGDFRNIGDGQTEQNAVFFRPLLGTFPNFVSLRSCQPVGDILAPARTKMFGVSVPMCLTALENKGFCTKRIAADCPDHGAGTGQGSTLGLCVAPSAQRPRRSFSNRPHAQRVGSAGGKGTGQGGMCMDGRNYSPVCNLSTKMQKARQSAPTYKSKKQKPQWLV